MKNLLEFDDLTYLNLTRFFYKQQLIFSRFGFKANLSQTIEILSVQKSPIEQNFPHSFSRLFTTQIQIKFNQIKLTRFLSFLQIFVESQRLTARLAKVTKI